MDVPWYAGHGGCLVVRLMGAIEVFFGCATRPLSGYNHYVLSTYSYVYQIVAKDYEFNLTTS